MAIDPEALPDNPGIAVKIALPNFMTENCHFLRAGFVVRGRKIAAENRRYTHNLEEILRHITAGVTLRVVFVADIDG